MITPESISIILPSRNNLKYLRWSYNSIRKNIGPKVEIILLDDASKDGTWEWMQGIEVLDKNVKIYRNRGFERMGHTILYDIGAQLSSTPIIMIFHADMYLSPNALKNAVPHLTENTVVSLTRVEPPLHPPDLSKHVIDFGMEPEEFKEKDFLNFVNAQQLSKTNKISNGFFAPWLIHKKDLLSIGGHDKRVFAPMELEDSDIGNRFLLNGYNLIQIRDAFVYHMTCRGSRFKDGVKIVQEIPVGPGQVWKRAQDSEEYTALRQNKFREWWRKWHMDVLHDSNMMPIVHPRYNIGFVVNPCPIQLLPHIEPWCDTIYVDLPQKTIDDYIEKQSQESKFNMTKRVKHISIVPDNDIVVSFDGTKFQQPQMNIIKEFPLMIQDSGELGIMEFDIFTLDIRKLECLKSRLINADDPWYIGQLI